jgi:tetratricopeptide (TPR) repeat protein
MRNRLKTVSGTREYRASEQADCVTALIELIQRSVGKVIVVVGPRNSGITQLIRERVLPRLEAQESTAFVDCATQITDEVIESIGRPNTIVILDSFNRFLRLPGSIQEPGLKAIFSAHRRATVVLVADKQSLVDLSDLREFEPDILRSLFELPELKLRAELEAYRPSSGAAALSWEPSILKALEDDLARFADSTVTPRLIEIIDDGFRASAYDQDRGLIGILERHLKQTLLRMDEEPSLGQDDEDTALAVLKEMTIRGEFGKNLFEEIATRLDVQAETVSRCQRWLVECSGLIKESTTDELIFQPPQLAFVLEKQLKEDRDSCAKAERYLADGIEWRNKVGALLPRERFREIDALRTLFRTTPEQASFLLQCALRSDPDRDPGPVNYWLRRVGDPALEVNALGDALIDRSFRSRRRAASLLARLDEPRVHGHLCRAALEDDSEDVRRQAVRSLSTFANKEPIREVLTRASLKGEDDVRIRAIQALYIFPDESCAHLLERIVGSEERDDVRAAAIDALALTRCEAGVSALVRIALHDADKEDRVRAAAALSDLDIKDLTEFGINAVFQDWTAMRPAKGRSWWKKLGHWPAALMIAILSVFIHGLPLLIFRRWLVGAAFIAVEVACYLAAANDLGGWWVLVWLLNWYVSVATGAWVARRKQTHPGSFYHVLSNAFLFHAMLTGGLFVHGLGHWITGRKRQAWQMMSVEAVAVLAILPTFFLKNFFNIGIARGFFDTLTVGLLYLYRFGGIALSWLWAVSSLTFEERWGRTRPWLAEEHSRVLRSLLKASGSAQVLRRHLVGEPSNARAASKLIGRLGDSIPGSALLSVVKQDALELTRTPREILMCLARQKDRKGFETVISDTGELFDLLPMSQRDQLVDILARHPTEGSVRCLFERRASLRPWNRIRLLIAMVVRPFRGWNKAVRLASLAAVFLAALIIADGIRANFNPGWPQIKELRRLSIIKYPDRSKDVATIAQFLAVRYPASSADELVIVFREQNESNGYAAGLVASLGWLATSDNAESDFGIEAERQARLDSVSALIEAMTDANKKPQTARAAEIAIQEAVKRGGSIELLDGLARFLDKTSSAETPTVPSRYSQVTGVLQGRVADMLADMARPSTDDPNRPGHMYEAKKTIAEHASSLGALLRTSTIREVKLAALGALEASGSREAVDTIKEFILSEAIPTPPSLPSGALAVDPMRARERDNLVRLQLECRVAAVDSLRTIQNPAAETALENLLKLDKSGLPPEVASKLEMPYGHAAAVSLDDQARTLLIKGETSEALKKARAAVVADKDYPEAHGTLGSILYQLRELDAALYEFRRATDIAPVYSWAYYMQGIVLNEKSDFVNAIGVLWRAIEIEPNYPWTYRLFVQILVDKQLEQEAINKLKEYAQKYPDVAEIYLQLAYVYHEYVSRTDQGAYQQTYEALKKAIEILKGRDPDQALTAELNFAESELTTGRYKDLIDSAAGLIDRVGADPDRIMALDILKLSAQVLLNDDRGALETLAHFESIYKLEFKQKAKWHKWIYDGTIRYVENIRPSSKKTEALMALLRAVDGISSDHITDGQPPSIEPELFEALRRELSGSKDSLSSRLEPPY